MTFKTTKVAPVNGFDLHETTDSQKSLFATAVDDNKVVGSAWGPAADGTGEWFAWRSGSGARRVESRETAIEYITTTTEEAPR